MAPYGESKLLRCTRGAVFDVAVDLRPDSPTYRQWQGHVLDAEDRTMVFVPVGCAHGYQALEDDAEVSYQVSHPYVPGIGARHPLERPDARRSPGRSPTT